MESRRVVDRRALEYSEACRPRPTHAPVYRAASLCLVGVLGLTLWLVVLTALARGAAAEERPEIPGPVGPGEIGPISVRSVMWPFYEPREGMDKLTWCEQAARILLDLDAPDFERALVHCAIASSGWVFGDDATPENRARSAAVDPAKHGRLALELLPRDSALRLELHWLLGWAAVRAGKFPLADSHVQSLITWRERTMPSINRAEERHSWDKWVMVRRRRVRWLHGEHLQGRGQGVEAARMLVAAVRGEFMEGMKPDIISRSDLITAARYAVVEEDYDLARETIQLAMSWFPEDASLPYWELCMDLGGLSKDGQPSITGRWQGPRTHERLKRFVGDITRYPRGAEYTVSAASVAIGAQKWPEALELFDLALKEPQVLAWLRKHPEQRDGFISAIVIALRLDQPDRAARLHLLLQGLSPQPISTDLIIRQAFLQYQDAQGQSEKARKAFEEAKRRAREEAERKGLIDEQGRYKPSLVGSLRGPDEDISRTRRHTTAESEATDWMSILLVGLVLAGVVVVVVRARRQTPS